MAPGARYESDNVDAAPLGKPLQFEFSSKTAPNRFLKAAMTERISSWDPKNFEARGIPSSNLVNVYKRWGEGDLGTILTGNIMIEYDQLEAAGNAIIPRTASFSGERFDAFADLAAASKKHGSLIVGQVSHPGRQVESRIQKNPVSASDVQLEGNIMGMTFEKPHPASTEEIERITDGFAHAAEYLHKAGYDGIELHGAHGYLLAQFLSPSTNHRTDQYGGKLANRSRLIIEIAQAIRKRVPPSFIVGIKLNSPTASTSSSSAAAPTNPSPSPPPKKSTRQRESFFLDFAETIAPARHRTKTYITGGFKTVGAMVQALDVVDGVGLARPVCQEPRLGRDILCGRVQGAIRQRLDEASFGLTNVAAGTHIRTMGKDGEPIDLSAEADVEAFTKDMGAWSETMGRDTGMDSFGYVDLESVTAAPYGTAD
ncbi:MAG: hypothetical protein LQ347_006683 [Umbilicaria vellea]|nr:MAG: hypothetical protein LQ347_006683 [Umbilicaria vellea]